MRTREICLLLITAGLLGCAANKNSSETCLAPLEGYSTEDLSGIWTVFHLDRTDILIIKPDGFYKQIVKLDKPPTNYESDWLPWYIDYMGYSAYIHLEGLSLCAARGDGACTRPEEDGVTWDICSDSTIYQPADGFRLTILAASEDWPMHLDVGGTPGTSGWSYSRILKEFSLLPEYPNPSP